MACNGARGAVDREGGSTLHVDELIRHRLRELRENRVFVSFYLFQLHANALSTQDNAHFLRIPSTEREREREREREKERESREAEDWKE